MGLFTTKCHNPACGKRIPKAAKFCRHCGQGAPRTTGKCPGCGKEVSVTSKFCWSCGTQLPEFEPPKIHDDRWVRTPGDFAVRIEDDDVNGKWVKPLIIDHGTRALYFQAGRYKGELKEGRYNVDGILARLPFLGTPRQISVILFDGGDVSIDLENGGLWTADRIEIGVISRAILKLDNPEALYTNLMKGTRRVTLDQIENQIAAEVQSMMAGIIQGYTADKLYTTIEIRKEIENKLRSHLAQTFSRFGLALVQIQFVDFHGELYEQIREQKGELRKGEGRLEIESEKLELQRKALDLRARQIEAEEERLRKEGRARHSAEWQRIQNEKDEVEREREKLRMQTDREWAQVNREEAQVDMKAARTRLAQKLREALSEDKFHEIKTRADLENFVRQTQHELGMKDVIRGDELQRLSARLEYEKDREALLRRFELIGIANDQQREEAWRALQHDERVKDEQHLRELERQLMSDRTDVDRKKLEAEKARVEHRLKMEVATDQRSFQREQVRADHGVKQEIRQTDFEQRLHERRGEHDVDMQVHADEHNLDVQKKRDEQDLRRSQLDDDLGRKHKDRRFDTDVEMEKAKAGVDRLRDVKDIELNEAEKLAQVEKTQLEARSKATVEALISIVDGPNAGNRLSELEQLRVKANLSPEQILAITAEASPQAAQALMQKYVTDGQVSAKDEALKQMEQRLADEQQRRVQEQQFRQEQQAVHDRRVTEQRSIADSGGDRLERLMQTALREMGEVASTRATPDRTVHEHHNQTVIGGGGGGGPVVVGGPGGGGGGTIVVCAGCNHRNPSGSTFCESCGKKLG